MAATAPSNQDDRLQEVKSLLAVDQISAMSLIRLIEKKGRRRASWCTNHCNAHCSDHK